MLRLFVSFFFLITWIGAQGVSFPSLDKFFTEGYETRAEITDTVKRNISLIVDEYVDFRFSIGRVDLKVSGIRESVYYSFSSQKLTRVIPIDNFCEVNAIDKHTFPNSQFLWGWKYADPKSNIFMFGPSSILLKIKAKNLTPKYQDDQEVRGIKTQHFALEDDGAQYDLYFTIPGWKSTFGNTTWPRLVRVKTTVENAKGEDGNDLGKLNLLTDFTFTKIIEDESSLNIQIPYGIGCPGLPAVSHDSEAPTSFSFTAEIVNSYNKTQVEDSKLIYYHKMTHSETMKLTRVEAFDERKQGFYEIHDNNTGLLYLFSPDGYCSIKTLEPESIKTEGGLFAGFLFDFYNTKDIYYLGEFIIRDIPCIAWELVKNNSVISQNIYDKVVVTYFFVKPTWKVVEDDAEEIKTISQIVISGYNFNKTTKAHELIYRNKVNIFDYRIDFTSDADELFNVEKCYFSPNNRKLIEIQFKSDFESSLIAEDNAGMFKRLIKVALIELLGITPLRLPFMSVDFERNNIYVQALVLERSDPLKSFQSFRIKGMSQDAKPLEGVKQDPTICAEACILDEDCKSFYFCEKNCYLSSNPQPPLINEPDAKACMFYARGGVQPKPQVTLFHFMKQLREAIDSNSFFVSLYSESEKEERKFHASKVEEIHPRSVITRIRNNSD